MEVVRKQLAKLVCPRLSHVSLKELCGGRSGGRALGAMCATKLQGQMCLVSQRF